MCRFFFVCLPPVRSALVQQFSGLPCVCLPMHPRTESSITPTRCTCAHLLAPLPSAKTFPLLSRPAKVSRNSDRDREKERQTDRPMKPAEEDHRELVMKTVEQASIDRLLVALLSVFFVSKVNFVFSCFLFIPSSFHSPFFFVHEVQKKCGVCTRNCCCPLHAHPGLTHWFSFPSFPSRTSFSVPPVLFSLFLLFSNTSFTLD